MNRRPVRLKVLLQQRHWHNHGSFCREYRKAANTIDASLAKSPPSRQQLHRWLAGDIKGLPHADHCQVLEAMLPGWTVAQLFEPDAGESTSGAAPGGDANLGPVVSAISTGLQEPDDDALGWAEVDTSDRAVVSANLEQASDRTRELGAKLLALGRDRQFSAEETGSIAALAGRTIELDLTIDLTIAEDGAVSITYRHELLNLSSRPFTRLDRELWFKYTDGGVKIEPVGNDRSVGIQRLHDTPTLAKFACQISPPLQPGDIATVGYRGTGGRFEDAHYWRQAIRRHTRELTLTVRDHRVGHLASCAGVEELPSGLEHSVADSLVWTSEDDHVRIELTRSHLSPNQAVDLRWELPDAAA